MTDNNVAKVANNFECKLCNYNTCKKSNYNKHLLTLKHINLHNTDKNVAKVASFNCLCGKSYKHRQSLYTHQSKCTFKDKESVCEKISENLSQEFVLDVIKKQQDQITELTNTIKEMAPLINSNTVNNNQKFNINVFLNEQCKDAINMSDFIKSLKVNLEELDIIKENGLAEGISKTIINNMSKLSIYERPLHCTDIKRETLYIKEDDTWTKDKNKEKIKEAIKKTSSKNYNALQEWKESNPDYMNNEDKTDYFAKTISTIGKIDNNIDNKIIKNICKETYIKET
tara:strand:+ start:302 stop:1156 length:855 start_codon:yes stop_codon:yes gene_type:complete